MASEKGMTPPLLFMPLLLAQNTRFRPTNNYYFSRLEVQQAYEPPLQDRFLAAAQDEILFLNEWNALY